MLLLESRRKGSAAGSARPACGRSKLIHLIGAGEVALCRRRGYERLDRAGQIGQGFRNGNQLDALTLHSFILPRSPDKTLQETKGDAL